MLLVVAALCCCWSELGAEVALLAGLLPPATAPAAVGVLALGVRPNWLSWCCALLLLLLMAALAACQAPRLANTHHLRVSCPSWSPA